MTSPAILYQNAGHDIILIDIPMSIAVAQGRSDVLLSSVPLETPIRLQTGSRHQSNKGKEKAAAQSNLNSAQHAEYRALIESALAQISVNVTGEWCRPRQYLEHEKLQLPDPEEHLEFRLREWAACRKTQSNSMASNLQTMMASLGVVDEHHVAHGAEAKWVKSYQPKREVRNHQETVQSLCGESEPWTCTFHNPQDISLQLTISQPTPQLALPGQEYRFTIPPRSTLFLSDSSYSQEFRTSLREVTNEYSLPRHFDLLLLDPPWPSRSVKRKGAYEQVGGMPHIKNWLLKMDMDSYLKHNALVGVWITNKNSLREHVLGPGGLFEMWNVGLIEEWVWIKTTTKGEPMFDIDNPLRKPYEILLLGRASPSPWTTMTHASPVRKRVIAAVPDIHSRKPCLKELLEAYMTIPSTYSALEVFSRYLVSGWTSWGNEVLKYNWNEYWVKR